MSENRQISTEKYLTHILTRYRRSFDIYRNWEGNGRIFPAYAWYSSRDEKYVLSRKINLWAAENYEHVLFLEEEICTEKTLEQIRQLMEEFMDPVLVRNGQKYPEKDHMCSVLSVTVLSKKTPDEGTIRAIRKYRYEKGYLFSLRGHVEGHLVVVDLQKEKIHTNALGRKVAKIYSDVFTDIRNEQDYNG